MLLIILVPEEEPHYFYSWISWVFEKCHKLLKDGIVVILSRMVFDISHDFSRRPFRVAWRIRRTKFRLTLSCLEYGLALF